MWGANTEQRLEVLSTTFPEAGVAFRCAQPSTSRIANVSVHRKLASTRLASRDSLVDTSPEPVVVDILVHQDPKDPCTWREIL